MQHTGIIMIRLAHRKARGFHRSIWKILRLQNTKSILLCISLHDITWRQKGWANFCWKKIKMNSTHKKIIVLVTFKWLWKLDLSGQSVVNLMKWVNWLGRSQCSFSLLLLSLWCACLHFQMPPFCTCRWTESCLTGKEKKKICILISVSTILPVGLIPLTRAFTPPPALVASAVAAKLFFFFDIIVNIFRSLPGSMSG